VGTRPKILSGYRFNRRFPIVKRSLHLSPSAVFDPRSVLSLPHESRCRKASPSPFATRGDATPKKHVLDTRRCRLEQRANGQPQTRENE
jgi:hypothetical protein